MEENLNDVRPASQTPPAEYHTAPIECSDEYWTVRIPKRKIKKFFKVFFAVLFIFSLWMNLLFIHSMARGMHGRAYSIGFQRPAQSQMYRYNSKGGMMGGGNTYFGYGQRQDNSFSAKGQGGYYSGKGQDSYFSDNYQRPGK